MAFWSRLFGSRQDERAEARRRGIDWSEEYLEFEADSGSIAAFWEEWGGASKVEQIEGWLRALDACG